MPVPVTLSQEFDEVIRPWKLLEHPFYRAWTAGTLPIEALRSYAREYGAFIARLADGWKSVGNTQHADEERQHAALWEDFVEALGAQVGEPAIPEVKSLLETCDDLFNEPDQAWGALYAFEAQQPATSASKLAGLAAFYDLPTRAGAYFEVHANDTYEADMIIEHLRGATEEARHAALRACRTMAESLWNALSGVHALYCPN
ncbi:MAG: iron-containing redox enzyme family protein [Acidimicrobiia bacterium]